MAAIKQNVSKLSARSGVGERGPGRGERHRGCPRFGGGEGRSLISGESRSCRAGVHGGGTWARGAVGSRGCWGAGTRRAAPGGVLGYRRAAPVGPYCAGARWAAPRGGCGSLSAGVQRAVPGGRSRGAGAWRGSPRRGPQAQAWGPRAAPGSREGAAMLGRGAARGCGLLLRAASRALSLSHSRVRAWGEPSRVCWGLSRLSGCLGARFEGRGAVRGCP